MSCRLLRVTLALKLLLAGALASRGAQPQLLAHWKLAGDARDSSGNGLDLTPHGIDLNATGPDGTASSAASFDGRDDYLELKVAGKLKLRTDDFTLSLWLHTDVELEDVLGDLVSQYDPETRTGFHLSIQNLAGVTTGQPNFRQLHFGIDQGRLEESWTDHGRLGEAVFVFALAVHDGRLHAATCEAGKDQRGHVFRWEGGDRWTDLGSPDACNAVSSLASFHGSLYAATSKYRLGGSSLAESENPNLGGKIFRLDEGRWTHVGTLPEVEAIGSLAEFRGKLHASSLYRPGGLFRMDGEQKWTPCGTPDGKRVEALAVYNGYMWATGYDEAGIYRYDGTRWEHMGKAGEGTQTYGLAVHRGGLYVSQWPQARVFRYGGDTKWLDVGRLGEELESMPLVVYNGKLYGGTLPLAEVYRFDGDGRWTQVGRLDHTPDVRYRRTWSMAIYRGRLFCGTLPSGHVHSIEAGKNVTLDRELAPGWRHIAAARRGDKLELYVDGKLSASSASFNPREYDLSTTQPLRIGFGANDYFRGKLVDVRLYRGALSADVIAEHFAAGKPVK